MRALDELRALCHDPRRRAEGVRMPDELDETSSSEPADAQIERGWTDRGLPPALLVKARTLRISDTHIERLLFWNAPVERIEEEIRWADQLNNGTMRFRQVTVADNDEFCELWANAPEEIGEWDVTVERGPNGFAQFELQERPALNVLV